MTETNSPLVSQPINPYQFQQNVRDTFLDGADIILQAPTGAGKTRASMLPALIGFERSVTEHPQRLIYGVPMRVLANSFVSEFEKTAVENTKWQRYNWKPSIQTGERSEDNLFEGQIVFATVDQMLASFLNIPYGIPKKLDNINAGAFIGSYLIFDEVHLYPTSQMFLSVLAMLKMLEGITRFTLMSATLTPGLINAIENLLGATPIYEASDIPLAQGKFKDIEHLQKQKRKWKTCDGEISGSEILHALDSNENRKILCICNTVDRAQTVFEQLKGSQPDDVDICLLHSRFYQKHRSAHEKFAIGCLGKEPKDTHRRTVIVATQVVEVGLDISADLLLTECAPAASLIQRAGRCARWGGNGQVWVYQPPVDEKSNQPSYVPYVDDGLESVCQITWDTLKSKFDNQVLQYEKEQQLVEASHNAHDQEYIIDELETKIERRIEDMLDCMRNNDDTQTDKLIRKNSSVSLYISELKDKHLKQLTDVPHQLEAFGVSKGRIKRAFEEMLDAGIQADFYFAAGREDDRQQDAEDLQSKTRYIWHEIRTPDEVFSEVRFVAHPLAVAYDETFGLRWVNWHEIPAECSPYTPKESNWHRTGYNQDTYVQHINGLMRAFTQPHTNKNWRALQDDYAYALWRVQTVMGREKSLDKIEKYLRLTIALHDVGKLNQQWQTWAQAWQRAFAQHHVDVPPPDGTPLAHTDTSFADENKEQVVNASFKAMRVPPRGSHAVEGAESASDLVWVLTGEDWFWYSVIIAAICHHHTPKADSCKDYRMVDNATASLIEALVTCGFTQDEATVWVSQLKRTFTRHTRRTSTAIKRVKPARSDYHTALMYYLFVRILRLADQRSSIYVHTTNME